METAADILVWTVFLLSSFAMCFAGAALKCSDARALRLYSLVKRAFYLAVFLCCTVYGLFLYAFIANNFSLASVAAFSSKALSTGYRISASWASPAGSFFLMTVTVFVLVTVAVRPGKIEKLKFNLVSIMIGAGLCAFLAYILIFAAKPFETVTVTLNDGIGLNPLLQNFWNIIHPPLLFIGYGGFAAGFVCSVSIIFCGLSKDAAAVSRLKGWILFSFCLLSLGIITGSRWSYLELGWGGYWGWDPVENASLLPWLWSAAVIHCIAGMKISEKFRSRALMLAPGCFVLCVFAAFITRSGILHSIHSFSENAFLAVFAALLGGCFLLWMLSAWAVVKNNSGGAWAFKKSTVIAGAVIAFIVCAVIIGGATLWPAISRAFLDKPSVLKRDFYDEIIFVFALILAVLFVLVWISQIRKNRFFIIKLIAACIAAVVCFTVILKYLHYDLKIAVVCAACAMAMVSVIFRLKRASHITAAIAHIGILVFIVSAAVSTNQQVVQLSLTKGVVSQFAGYEILYNRFDHSIEKGVAKAGPEIIVKKGRYERSLQPYTAFYRDGRQTSEAAVISRLTGDLYMTFDGLSGSNIMVTVRYNPAMMLLWIAAIITIAGCAAAIFLRTKKI